MKNSWKFTRKALLNAFYTHDIKNRVRVYTELLFLANGEKNTDHLVETLRVC